MTSLLQTHAVASSQSESPCQDFFDHFVHSNHPLFGIQHSRCTEKLTGDNWQDKGLLNPQSQVYIYLNQAVSLQKNTQFTCVNYYSAQENTSEQHFFGSVKKALKFANKIHKQALDDFSSTVATV